MSGKAFEPLQTPLVIRDGLEPRPAARYEVRQFHLQTEGRIERGFALDFEEARIEQMQGLLGAISQDVVFNPLDGREMGRIDRVQLRQLGALVRFKRPGVAVAERIYEWRQRRRFAGARHAERLQHAIRLLAPNEESLQPLGIAGGRRRSLSLRLFGQCRARSRHQDHERHQTRPVRCASATLTHALPLFLPNSMTAPFPAVVSDSMTRLLRHEQCRRKKLSIYASGRHRRSWSSPAMSR